MTPTATPWFDRLARASHALRRPSTADAGIPDPASIHVPADDVIWWVDGGHPDYDDDRCPNSGLLGDFPEATT